MLTRSSRKFFSIFARAILFPMSLAVSVASAETWDLAADWSDSVNPNGVWSYNGSPGVPITTHWDDWDPTNGCCFTDPQPAWALTAWPDVDHVPMWMKVTSATTTAVPDFPIGRVLMHGVEGTAPPIDAGVSWTSPINGEITIAGGVWLGNFVSTRAMDWTILLNGVPLTGGNLNAANPGTSVAPVAYQDGSGGAGALTQNVFIGDVITLEFSKTTTFATFVGVDLAINYQPPVCEIELDKPVYVDGDTVIVNQFRIANPGSSPVAVELKAWLGLPGNPPVSFINIGANGGFVLPPGTDIMPAPFPLFFVNETLARGNYELSCRMLHPVTGGILAEDLNVFAIQ